MNPVENNQEYDIEQWKNRHTVEYMKKWEAGKVGKVKLTDKRKYISRL